MAPNLLIHLYYNCIRRKLRHVTPLLLMLALLPGAALPNEIGSVTELRSYAYRTLPEGSKRPLFAREKVSENEVLETVSDGFLAIRFMDGTDFILGAGSTVTLDAFVYDANTSVGKMSMVLGKGVFRFVSGNMRKSGVSLKTPTATIGIRGTDFVIAVGNDNTTSIEVFRWRG